MADDLSLEPPWLVTSANGWSVQVLGMSKVRYREGDRSIVIDAEALATEPSSMNLYPGSMKRWDPPNDSIALDEDEQQKIIANVQRAFEFRGWQLHLW